MIKIFSVGILRSKSVMLKNSITVILVALLIVASAYAAAANESPVADGFGLMGVDGKLTDENTVDKWFFTFDADVNSRSGRINAGAKFEMLPSATLEKMVANLQQHPDIGYRLWGKVTKYGEKNYIFADYFLPISEVKKPKPAQGSQEEVEIKINEPNDELPMPEEIVAKLQSRKVIHFEQLSEGLKLKEDSILADRIGFILSGATRDVYHAQGRTQSAAVNKYSSFASDALGRNVGTIRIQLLPCEMLETAQKEQATEAEPLRFKVAGIITTYKGRYYLLLQRATIVYNYGNF
jgi:hypothetical protein